MSSASKSLWYDAWVRLKRNRASVISAFFIIAVCFAAIFAKNITPYSFEEQHIDRVLEGPSSDFWFGTDDLGRDLFSRLVYGAQMSMSVGIITAVLSLFLGLVYGATAGWFGGRIDSIMMRLIDIMDSIPALVLLILVRIFFDAVAASSVSNPETYELLKTLHLNGIFENPQFRALTGVLLALSVLGWLTEARIVRAQVLQAKESLYVEAARAMGARSFFIILRHVLPNILGPIIVVLTFQIPSNIMFESFLSFIGLGLQPPFSSWGVLASTGWKTIKTYPHLIIAPGMALFLTMLAFNMFGDGLRDAFDPKLKNR